MKVQVTLTNKARFNTALAPLAVLGYSLMKAGVFDPLLTQVQVPMRTRDYAPSTKLMDCLISILAGCTSIQQINVRLRPDRVLAEAWGRPQFAEQSTITDTLDACTAETLQALRQVHQQLLTRYGRTPHHDFQHGPLWIDVDLSPLPASRRAEASTRGYASGKKTCAVVSWPGSVHRNITRLCSPGSFRAIRPVPVRFSRSSWSWSGRWPGGRVNGTRSLYAVTADAAPTGISTGNCGAIIKS
jgi:hypothetical protein